MEKLNLSKMACIVFVFCIATAIASPAQTFTTLLSFDGTNGANPEAPLVQGTDGNFYGTTFHGGADSSGCNGYGCGTVFKITTGGTLTTLYSFCSQTNCTDGAAPRGGLVQATDGNFYGTTSEGGANNNCTNGCGTIFKITAGGTLTTLHSFGGTDGSDPVAGLVQATDGNFYGTAGNGGAYGFGTVFKITPAGTLTTLYSFCSQSGCADGETPYGALVQATDGNFYGTTAFDGANRCDGIGCGTVFKITAGGTLTTLHTFDGTDGHEPWAGLVQATDGNFYGTTLAGGNYNACDNGGCGTVFKITPSGTLTTLHIFAGYGNDDGALSFAALVQATDGNFYGTTSLGGDYGCERSLVDAGCGTVFEITPGGTLTTLHNFVRTDGLEPSAGLVQATNGIFYGTAVEGGANDPDGTVFSLSVGLGGPAVTLSPTSLSFGNHVINTTSATKSVTVTNTGSATLDISSITASANFAVSSTTCGATLAAGKKCKVSVTFTPVALGALTGTLSFTDNAPDSPQTVALAGAGIVQATLTPASATYAKQKVGTTSKPKTFTLTNNQPETLSGIAITATGDFAVSATTCETSLGAKKKCTISMTFTPTGTGASTGQLSVSDSASNSPQTSKLTGTGK